MSKPLNRKNYGSVPHLLGSKKDQTDKYVHEGQHRILTEQVRDKHDVVIVTEKYDGSNVGVAKVDGKIIALTRAGYLAETSPYKMHHRFSEWVRLYSDRFVEILSEGERLCGEWMMQVHGTRYRVNGREDLTVWFDWIDVDNKRKPFLEMSEAVTDLGMIPARLVSLGPAVSIGDAFNNLLQQIVDELYWVQTSNPEGLVYRVERKGQFDFMAKWVQSRHQPGKYLPGIGLPEDAEPIWNVNPLTLAIDTP